jgi:hypothetical protein
LFKNKQCFIKTLLVSAAPHLVEVLLSLDTWSDIALTTEWK